MKQKKELTQQNSSLKILKHLSLTLIILFSIFNYGCDKEDFDQYYVKYKIESSNIDLDNKLNVSFKTDNDNNISSIIINQNRNWEMIIGPVSRGFNATLEVWNSNNAPNNLQLIAEIHICKNDSPFSFKAIKSIENNPNHYTKGLSLNYVIEY